MRNSTSNFKTKNSKPYVVKVQLPQSVKQNTIITFLKIIMEFFKPTQK